MKLDVNVNIVFPFFASMYRSIRAAAKVVARALEDDESGSSEEDLSDQGRNYGSGM